MISFPCFTCNNANVGPCCNIQNDSNYSCPIMVSFPAINYLTPYCSYYNISNLFISNSSNQIPILEHDSFNNLQSASINNPHPRKDDSINNNVNFNSNFQKNDFEKVDNNIKEFNMKSAEIANKNDNKSNIYANIGSKISFNGNKKSIRTHFTKNEDDKIIELVKKFGTKKWTIVAAFMKGRTAKQCRDRYSNYLIPGIFNGEWSREEDELLVKLFKENGSKWSVIHKYFPKRSANSIKNRWYYFLCKTIENIQENDENGENNIEENKEELSSFRDLIMFENTNQNENNSSESKDVKEEGSEIADNNQEMNNFLDIKIDSFSNLDENDWGLF